jgi:hypothetical protein
LFFLDLCKEKRHDAKIKFLDIYKTNLDDSDFLVEKFLDGEYRKFNSNQFLINTKSTEILNDFSLWTYKFTEQKLMVVDLQGVIKLDKEGKTCFCLTDPAINSINRSFGATDMGEQGIMGCIYTSSLSRHDLNSNYSWPNLN